jgi:hypothetical protein
MTLDILVLESEPGVADTARRALADAGHRVLRCHDEDAPGFPCRGLVDADACPLSSHVDVALTVRSARASDPTPSEDGVRCALMRRVPLVVAGSAPSDAFVELGAFVVESSADVSAACEAAAEAEMADYARRAEAILIQTVGAAAPTRVTVVRRNEGLVVTIAGLDACSRELRQAAVVRVLAELRGIDRSAITTDVVLARDLP